MKTSIALMALALGVAAYLHASVKQQQGYQTATVVSVKQLDTQPDPIVGSNPSDAPAAPEEYAYEIGLKVNCTLFTGRYESATDYLPAYFKPNNNVDARVEKHWIYVSLPSDREVKLGLVGHKAVHDGGCAQ